MFRKVSVYQHKKYKSLFIGSYETKGGDRSFKLLGKVASKERIISYESPFAAVKDGWVRIKVIRVKVGKDALAIANKENK